MLLATHCDSDGDPLTVAVAVTVKVAVMTVVQVAHWRVFHMWSSIVNNQLNLVVSEEGGHTQHHRLQTQRLKHHLFTSWMPSVYRPVNTQR